MSRNVPRRQNPHMGQKSAKKKTPISSRSSTSSDDDYAGVDLITDTSDENEPDVEEAEASAIRELGRITDSELDSASEAEDDQLSLGVLEAQDSEFWGFPEPVDEPNFPPLPDNVPLRARGQSPQAKSSSSISDQDVDYHVADDPDAFLVFESLRPSFQDKIMNEDDIASSNGSYWDLEDEHGQQNFMGEDAGCNSDENGSSSGYENDDGDTTDEELPNPQKFVPLRRSVLRPLEDSDSEEEVSVIPRKKPQLGNFAREAQTPFVVTDRSGRSINMVCSGKRRVLLGPSGHTWEIDVSPMEMSAMTNSANVMVGAMFAPGDFLGNMLSPEAFYPHPSNLLGTLMDSSSYDEDEYDSVGDHESILDLENFVDFGDTSSDEEGDTGNTGDKGEVSTYGAEAPSPTHARGNRLDHLDHLRSNQSISAFRNNQDQHQRLIRNAATKEGLAFSNSFGQGPIRGIKTNRLAAANTPITPLRKQKSLREVVASSPGSPLASAAAQKRKPSGELSNQHKRNRSVV